MLDKIFSETGMVTAMKELDATSLRQKIIANNIANVNTPGFKRSDVSFEDKLQAAIGSENGSLVTTNPMHFSSGVSSSLIEGISPEVVADGSPAVREDGNNVDVDKEMTDLAKNTITNESFNKILSDKFKTLQTVINGR